jgi:hypothetical protein
MDFGTAEFHEFGFDAFLFEFAQGMAEQNCCIRASAGTTVERDDLHVSSVSQDRVNERPYSLAKEQPTLRGSLRVLPVVASRSAYMLLLEEPPQVVIKADINGAEKCGQSQQSSGNIQELRCHLDGLALGSVLNLH